ncbi:glutathione S-transferase family protein [Aquibaculum arenosum]|uniref:Glutathione S-transferase N-terminal domain-containing protein n=1 Tax=Aquibaculum arenosum TaxID=3032591 RepID=A0ABT5YMR5_9PROT|nr:glutathione binding-like protein [Fodinicurvata sp. CAU 1616]MDF2096203.1 glutathione S-transferase N-terminal domain-containing protein [Fodinicurvata sp. CAU 1616]
MTIDLYTWSTPNGYKVSIALEELGLPYNVHPINITQDEQLAPDFLKISPNNKIPAIVDPDGPEGKPLALFESGAILLYLAEKTGQLMPQEPRAYWQAVQWLMWQMGGFGPMLGQAHHFLRFAKEDVPYAKNRYANETRRLYGVLDKRLGEAEWLAGDSYSMADIATFPWAGRHEWQQVDLADFPNVKRWFDAIAARPAVQRGRVVPK